MADRSNSIQEHLNKDPKDGQELADINVTQGMVRSTLDQRSANLSTSRESIKSQESNNVELRGALEMASDQPQQQVQNLPPQASQLRPETQEILQKYGVNPNIRESRSHTSNVSKSGTTRTTTDMEGMVTNTTTINNVTNNNITTETNIETPPQASSSPQVVQTPVVQQQDNTSKFKAWLTGIFARRDNEAKIKDREYRKKEWELSRTTDKLMRRMEGVSRKFAEKSNPENIGRTFMSQLKLFATLFIANLLPKVWEPMMDGISTISENFMDLLGKGKGESFIGKLKKDVFGIEPGKDITFTEAISNAFSNTMDKIKPFFNQIGKDLSAIGGIIVSNLSKYFDSLLEDRKIAINAVNSSHKIDGITDIKGMAKYLGSMLAAVFGGTDAVKNKISEAISSQGFEDLRSQFGKYGQVVRKDGSIDFQKASGYDYSGISEDDAFERYFNENKEKYKDWGQTARQHAESDWKSNKDDVQKRYLNKLAIEKGNKSIIDTELYNLSNTSRTNTPALMDLLSQIQEYNKENPISISAKSLYTLGFPKQEVENIAKENNIQSSGDVSDDEKKIYEFKRGQFGELAGILGTLEFGKDYNSMLALELLRQVAVTNLGKTDWTSIGNNIIGSIAKIVGLPQKLLNELAKKKGGTVGTIAGWLTSGGSYDWGDKLLKNTEFVGRSSLSPEMLKSISYIEKGGKKFTGSDVVKGVMNDFSTYWSKAHPSKKSTDEGSNYKPTPITNKESMSNAKYIYDWLIKNGGFTPTQAAGITGVIMQESGCNPKAVNEEEAKKYGFHVSGKGICQWSNERNDDFINWYKSKTGTDEKVYPNQASLDDQLEFMLHEMSKRKKFMELMKSVEDGDVTSAADIMLRGYENGSEEGLASIEQMDKTYSKFNNSYNRQISDRSANAKYIYDRLNNKDSEVDVEEINNNSPNISSDISYKLRPEPSDMITHAGSYYEVNPPEIQTTLIPERTEARRNNTSNNYSPKRIENTEESKPSESASKESKSPVIVAPQTNNNGGNTTVNNTYYMTNIGKTNEALYGKGGE